MPIRLPDEFAAICAGSGLRQSLDEKPECLCRIRPDYRGSCKTYFNGRVERADRVDFEG